MEDAIAEGALGHRRTAALERSFILSGRVLFDGVPPAPVSAALQ